MKKLLLIAMGFLLAFQFAPSFSSAGEAGKLSGKKLRVGTMALVLGLPIRQAQKAGYFKDAGLDVEVIVFASGAPINEAMSAKQMDVGVSGMASVFGLATGSFKYVADGMITMEGQAIYARPDHPITKVKGPRDNLYGSAKLIKGANVLGPLSTSAHFHAIKYAEAFGLTSDDFNMVAMDHPQAMQAFLSGQGDFLACVAPYSNLIASKGYFRVSDLGASLGIQLTDTVFVQPEVLKDRRADLLAFLDCYYRAAADLNNDSALWKRIGQEWYGEEGRKVTDEQMADEIRQTRYTTLDSSLTGGKKFGETMMTIGKFFVEQGMIQPENYQNIEKSMDSSLIEELKAKHGIK